MLSKEERRGMGEIQRKQEQPGNEGKTATISIIKLCIN